MVWLVWGEVRRGKARMCWFLDSPNQLPLRLLAPPIKPPSLTHFYIHVENKFEQRAYLACLLTQLNPVNVYLSYVCFDMKYLPKQPQALGWIYLLTAVKILFAVKLITRSFIHSVLGELLGDWFYCTGTCEVKVWLRRRTIMIKLPVRLDLPPAPISVCRTWLWIRSMVVLIA